MMRHLPWCRLLLAGFAVIGLSLVLLGRYTSSPAVQATAKRGHGGDGAATAESPVTGRAEGDRPAARTAASAAAALKEAELPVKELPAAGRLGAGGAGKDGEPSAPDKGVSKPDRAGLDAPAAAADAAERPPPKGRVGTELAKGVGVAQAEAAGRPAAAGEGEPVAAAAAAAAVPKSHDGGGGPFEGLPLNVVVDIKASKPIVQVAPAAQSAPGPEATLEQLKRYFEPNMASKQFNASVLVVTPLRNARGHLSHYLDLLLSLSYPHGLISVALGEDSSIDSTYELATSLAKDKLADFRRVSVFHLDHVLYQGTDWSSVHAEGHQLERRGHLARARNELLSRALRDEEFVLWVDSDVGTWPADIVQHMLDARVDIVAPACMYRSNDGHVDVYDRNTWRETPSSLERQRQVGDDYLMLEGYGGQPRLYLPDLRGERQRLVKVDGVGGCVLLVRSVIHRRGLVFPSFVFRHHVETEGLAKMAAAMGHQCYGMPFLEVYHL